MKYLIFGKIFDAYQRYVNGFGTAKELTIYYSTKMEDIDGKFGGNESISMPISAFLDDASFDSLEGKKIKITIEIED